MRVHWVLPIVCHDGGEVEFTKFGEATVLPVQADVVALDGNASFSVIVDSVMHQVLTPFVRFMPSTATRQQIDWLMLNGWVEK